MSPPLNRLRTFWLSLVGSLWFVPSSIVVGAILLAVGMVELSTLVESDTLAEYSRFFSTSADSSRDLLAGIAGSMITVAGVTFSITMVAVTQASSQYTPRILRNFIEDRVNQVFLGVFVGVFAYCLVVMRAIRGDGEQAVVPSLAVLLAVLLALVGIAVLIFFVHHIATTLQASEIVARIARETTGAADRLFRRDIGEEVPHAGEKAVLDAVPSDRWRPVPGAETGYVQNIELDELLGLARDHDLVIRLEQGPGDFVCEGAPVAWFAAHPWGNNDGPPPAERVAGVVTGAYVVGTNRTMDQDPAFGLRQLVDIALKALSPGINDSTTAVTCVDYIGAILSSLANRYIDLPGRTDGTIVRIVAPGPTFDGLLHLGFDEIRRHAGGNVSVLKRQLETIAILARSVRSPARRERVLQEVDRLLEVVTLTVVSRHDQEQLRELAGRLRAAPDG